MKKYIIKYAGGIEQNIMQAVHNSYNEAVQTLMDYICDHNEDLDVDDNDYLSPFNFVLEEVECNEVNEVITDFDSARKVLGLKLNDYTLCEHLHKFIDQFISVINPKHINALVALNKLFTIAEAWNKEDGFVPDFSDCQQNKWFPWFKYDKDAAEFYVIANTAPSFAYSYFGSRLCFKTPERAEQFGKQFIDLWNEVFI